MRTLNEAIKSIEWKVEVCETVISRCDLNDPHEKDVAQDNREYAERHKQIAEWLKELKRLKEQEPCEDCVSREFMYELGATCIATRDKNDKLIALGTIENLPSVTPVQRWIPVSEKLPEEETDVLVLNENDDKEIARGSYSTEVVDEFIWYTSGWKFGKVIAWTPLPPTNQIHNT